MCGFVTIITPPAGAVSGSVLRAMTERLAHRGPDDAGYACVDPATGRFRTWPGGAPPEGPLAGVAFGHRRLSILDLGPAGHQPMLSEAGPSGRASAVAFNGEIYNFVELRRELESAGVCFRGSGDTEVLLRAYEQWGADALRRFNGMWAFALWDGRRRKLVVSRDRFGIKPLYYTRVGGAWVFASEIKALLAYPGAFRGRDEAKVGEYLTECHIDHDTSTLFRGIRSVPAASYLEVATAGPEGDARRDNGGEESRPTAFWHLRLEGRCRGRSDEELVDEFASLLSDAVRLRLRSDVPIGTMLSGGLDSTAITLLIHEQAAALGGFGNGNGAAHSAGARAFHHAFTAAYPGWAADETADAELICARVGLRSEKVFPTGETTRDVLPAVAYHLDEPFENPTAVIQYLLMREASSRGIKVVLNGHGADEVLGGYGRFVAPHLAGLLLARGPAEYAREAGCFGVSRRCRRRYVPIEVLRAVLPPTYGSRTRQMIRAARALRRPHYAGIYAPDVARAGLAAYDGDPVTARGRLSPLNRTLWQNFSRKSLPRWLRMEDRMSMAWSVESRLPFMDFRLVEFAFNLPERLKLRDGYTKYVLRQAMRDKLPERIVRNRVKTRFGSPYVEWFRGAWKPLIEDLLLIGTPKVAPYLNLKRLRPRLIDYLAGKDHPLDPQTLWRIFSTELWIRAFRG